MSSWISPASPLSYEMKCRPMHDAVLPGGLCDACGRTAGVEYFETANLTVAAKRLLARVPPVIPWPEFVALRSGLAQECPELAAANGGAMIGRLSVASDHRISSRYGIVEFGAGDVVISRPIFDRLLEAGIAMECQTLGVRTPMKRQSESWLRVVFPRADVLAEGERPEVCSACGRGKRVVGRNTFVDPEKISRHESLHAFRVQWCETIVVMSSKLRSKLQELGCRDIKYRPLPVRL
mgnify:CR=1 FL=1